MSVNRETPHVLVLPEDDANRQIAIGFQLNLDWSVQRRMQVLNPAGGWNRVLDAFEQEHVCEMDRNPHRFIVLLIDFDGDLDRLTYAKGKVPPRLADRVFFLGAFNDPEDLRRAGLGSYEEIGSKMAIDCHEESDEIWSHQLLRHNTGELKGLRDYVRSILF